jgi:hypothetical protein
MIGQLVTPLGFFILYILHFLIVSTLYRNNESPMCKFYTLQYNNISHHNQLLILYTDTLSYYCIIQHVRIPSVSFIICILYSNEDLCFPHRSWLSSCSPLLHKFLQVLVKFLFLPFFLVPVSHVFCYPARPHYIVN